MPSGLKTIGYQTFFNCHKLKSLDIPETVTEIGMYGLYGCNSLTTLDIPDGVTKIDDFTFYACSGLKELNLPAKLETIGESVFEYCSSLKSVFIPETVEQIAAGSIPKSITIDCYESSYAYEFAVNNNYNFIIHEIPADHEHKYVRIYAEPASCYQSGLEIYECSICHDDITEMLPQTAHKNKTVLEPATVYENGYTLVECRTCGDQSLSTILRISKVTSSLKSGTYNDKSQKAAITVKDSKGKILKSDTDYTYAVRDSYGRKVTSLQKAEKYTVTVSFKGKYAGSKKLTYTIAPKKPAVRSVSAGKKKVAVKWTDSKNDYSGYQLYCSTSSKFTKKTTKVITAAKLQKSKTIKGLKSGKKYYVKMRAYKKVKGGAVYSGWTPVKTVKVK